MSQDDFMREMARQQWLAMQAQQNSQLGLNQSLGQLGLGLNSGLGNALQSQYRQPASQPTNRKVLLLCD